MTQPYQWRADQPADTARSEPEVPLRQPTATPAPARTILPPQAYIPVAAPIRIPAPVTQPRPVVAPAPPAPHAADVKAEAAATLGAYQELGPDYQDAVIESFLNRLDQMNGARRPPTMPVPLQSQVPAQKKSGSGPTVAALTICMALAIPLTAIAGGMFGFVGLPITWVGIIIVALIVSRGLRRD